MTSSAGLSKNPHSLPPNTDSRQRMWCYTLNNYDLDTDMIDPDLYTYYVVGLEVSSTGTPHMQGFVIFKKAMRLYNVKQIHPTAHWEMKSPRSTPLQASDYCKKEGDFYESGECPSSNTGSSRGGAATKKNWEGAWSLAKSGLFEEMDKAILFPHYRTSKVIREDHRPTPIDLDGVCGHWFYGPPGTGKSHTARERWSGDGSFFYKPMTKWWCGYEDEVTVVIEDIDISHRLYAGYFLKIWADKFVFKGEYKGGARLYRPKRIVCTSNYTLEELFAHDPPILAALRRRFIVEHFQTVYVPPPVVVDQPMVDVSENSSVETVSSDDASGGV